jgi:hypothetical protein
MTSRYSIIQYVPNPIADERINIGVIVFDEEIIKVHFLRSWERVKAFGKEDIRFLRDFAARMVKASKDGLLFPHYDSNNELSRVDRVRKVSREWANSIQLTEPRGSLENIESVFQDVISTYLVDEIPPQKNTHGDEISQKRSNCIVMSIPQKRLRSRLTKSLKKEVVSKDKSLIGYHIRPVNLASKIEFTSDSQVQGLTIKPSTNKNIKTTTGFYPTTFLWNV